MTRCRSPPRPCWAVSKERPRVAGVVHRAIVLPGNVRGIQRTVLIAPDRLRHIQERRPEWFDFIMQFMQPTIEAPDFIGQRAHGDRRRVEFVRLVGAPGRWLLVSVKFLDGRAEAWVVLDSAPSRRYRVGGASRAVRTERSPSPPPRGFRRSRGHRLARFVTQGGLETSSPCCVAGRGRDADDTRHPAPRPENVRPGSARAPRPPRSRPSGREAGRA